MPLRTDWFFAALALIALGTAGAALAMPLFGPVMEQPAMQAFLRDVVVRQFFGV